MAPWPETGNEPKAPDKDEKHEIVNSNATLSLDEPSQNTNSTKNEQKPEEKEVLNLDDGQLKALLDEAITYKNPKDREGKSELFKELLQKAEVEVDDKGLGESLSGMDGGRRSRKRETLVSARQREGGSLPTDVNVDNDPDMDVICKNFTSRATLEVSGSSNEENASKEEPPTCMKVQGHMQNGMENSNTKEEERVPDTVYASSISQSSETECFIIDPKKQKNSDEVFFGDCENNLNDHSKIPRLEPKPFIPYPGDLPEISAKLTKSLKLEEGSNPEISKLTKKLLEKNQELEEIINKLEHLSKDEQSMSEVLALSQKLRDDNQKVGQHSKERGNKQAILRPLPPFLSAVQRKALSKKRCCPPIKLDSKKGVGPVESGAMLYPSTPVQHVSVLSIPPSQIHAGSDDHRISDSSEAKKLNVSRSRQHKKGHPSDELDSVSEGLLGLPHTAYWNRYSSFTLLDFQGVRGAEGGSSPTRAEPVCAHLYECDPEPYPYPYRPNTPENAQVWDLTSAPDCSFLKSKETKSQTFCSCTPTPNSRHTTPTRSHIPNPVNTSRNLQNSPKPGPLYTPSNPLNLPLSIPDNLPGVERGSATACVLPASEQRPSKQKGQCKAAPQAPATSATADQTTVSKKKWNRKSKKGATSNIEEDTNEPVNAQNEEDTNVPTNAKNENSPASPRLVLCPLHQPPGTEKEYPPCPDIERLEKMLDIMKRNAALKYPQLYSQRPSSSTCSSVSNKKLNLDHVSETSNATPPVSSWTPYILSLEKTKLASQFLLLAAENSPSYKKKHRRESKPYHSASKGGVHHSSLSFLGLGTSKTTHSVSKEEPEIPFLERVKDVPQTLPTPDKSSVPVNERNRSKSKATLPKSQETSENPLPIENVVSESQPLPVTDISPEVPSATEKGNVASCEESVIPPSEVVSSQSLPVPGNLPNKKETRNTPPKPNLPSNKEHPLKCFFEDNEEYPTPPMPPSRWLTPKQTLVKPEHSRKQGSPEPVPNTPEPVPIAPKISKKKEKRVDNEVKPELYVPQGRPTSQAEYQKHVQALKKTEELEQNTPPNPNLPSNKEHPLKCFFEDNEEYPTPPMPPSRWLTPKQTLVKPEHSRKQGSPEPVPNTPEPVPIAPKISKKKEKRVDNEVKPEPYVPQGRPTSQAEYQKHVQALKQTEEIERNIKLMKTHMHKNLLAAGKIRKSDNISSSADMNATQPSQDQYPAPELRSQRVKLRREPAAGDVVSASNISNDEKKRGSESTISASSEVDVVQPLNDLNQPAETVKGGKKRNRRKNKKAQAARLAESHAEISSGEIGEDSRAEPSTEESAVGSQVNADINGITYVDEIITFDLNSAKKIENIYNEAKERFEYLVESGAHLQGPIFTMDESLISASGGSPVRYEDVAPGQSLLLPHTEAQCSGEGTPMPSPPKDPLSVLDIPGPSWWEPSHSGSSWYDPATGGVQGRWEQHEDEGVAWWQEPQFQLEPAYICPHHDFCRLVNKMSNTQEGDPNTRLAFANTADGKTKPLDENGNALACVRMDSNCLDRKKQRRVKAKNDRNTILSDEIEGFRGGADIDTLMEYIESPSLDSKSNKARTNQSNGTRSGVKVRAKEEEPRSIRRRKDKFQRCNSLEEISKTKLEDLTEEGSSERVNGSSHPLAKKQVTLDDAELGKKSSWEEEIETASVHEAKDPKQERISPEPLQDSEFHVVTKKQRKKKRRTGCSSRGGSKQDYYSGRETGSGRLLYQYRRDQGAAQPRRKSASSVPPSDKSDSSDLDSVHSLPVSSSTRNRVGQNSVSGGSTPQASYADIAKTAASPPDGSQVNIDRHERCSANSSLTETEDRTSLPSMLPTPLASSKKDAMTDTNCDNTPLLKTEDYPPLEVNTLEFCTGTVRRSRSGARDIIVTVRRSRSGARDIIVATDRAVAKSETVIQDRESCDGPLSLPSDISCVKSSDTSANKRPPVILMHDPSRGDSQVPEIQFGFPVNYQLLQSEGYESNETVTPPPATTSALSPTPAPATRDGAVCSNFQDQNMIQYLTAAWEETMAKLRSGKARYYDGQ